MNAVMGFASAAEQLQRYDAVRRRNAENAYERQTQFRDHTNKTKDDLEALLRGEEEPVVKAATEKSDFQKLDAGQVKNIAIPLGNTLEETIALWRDVRKEAYSHAEMTTADYQLGSKASAKIAEAELQLALHNRAKTIRDKMHSASAAPTASSSMTEVAMDRMQRWYDTAFSAYSIQSQAKGNDYRIEWPEMSVSV
ncbi:hypothetical protein [Sporosarcina obsidiansis]|uniref:hypothetical protein n=1 Tax=Sporosarcina obsidiansis TaxID=2660748 RepID=UPI00129A890D|nr:hypothetical protein [Sporosarcina obsidiansis]